MIKRYQVFVSSTYDDLREERQAVMQALLELDCIPSGMELFPASDEEQWRFIKGVIDDSDYYVVILGGKYGSVGPDGKSYTQMEYEYALTSGKPVIAFLHEHPGELKANRTEPTEEGRKALDDFRQLAQKKLCKFWSSADQLGSVVSRSMVQLIRTKPAVGWVRADLAVNESASQEILRLLRRVEELEKEVKQRSDQPPAGAEKLAQGEDEINLHFVIHSTHFELRATWNDVFRTLAPKLMTPQTDQAMKQALAGLYGEKFQAASDVEAKLNIVTSDLNKIKIQLRALGLITHLEEEECLWVLTKYGDATMMRLMAITRPTVD